jgi:glutamate racemase
MTGQSSPSGCIGVFDSGVGGLSVWREMVRQLPSEDILYVADQAHVPYGSRSLSEVQGFCEGIVEFLLQQGAKIVVIACNAASAAALHHLRGLFPRVPFVGMEPAVKPAVQRTRTGTIGVIATQATFQGKLFASLIAEYGNRVRVLTQVGRGLVQAVEMGALETPETDALLCNCVAPLIDAGADQLVLGCTHYPFLRPALERLIGPGIGVIDPASAVALQTGRVLARCEMANDLRHLGRHRACTSGDTGGFAAGIERLLPYFAPGLQVQPVCWRNGRLRAD